MNRPKLIRVITRMNIGGPARHVTILTAGAPPEFESVLLTGDTGQREGSLLDDARRTGLEIRQVPNLQRTLSPFRDLRALFWLVRFFRKEKPQIVATHTAKAGALGRLAAFIAGVPVIVHTFHGHVLEGYFGSGGTRFFLAVERLLGRITTAFVAISPKIADDLDRLGIGRGKTVVVPLGLELETMLASEPGRLRADLGIPSGAVTVGIVGRLVPIKAHDLFLSSALDLSRRYPHAHFAIVGDGELWDDLHKEVAASGLSNRVHFTGWRRDLANVYSDLDIVVCCSRNEGTPVALIEACAAGRPVVGTAVGGVADVIEDGVNGLLVPSGDTNALTTALSMLIDDPDRRRLMGQAGRKLVMQRHGAERMVADLKRLYLDLLDGPALKPEAV